MINDFSVNAAWSKFPELAESMDQAAVLTLTLSSWCAAAKRRSCSAEDSSKTAPEGRNICQASRRFRLRLPVCSEARHRCPENRDPLPSGKPHLHRLHEFGPQNLTWIDCPTFFVLLIESSLMIVDDFHVVGFALPPHEADAILSLIRMLCWSLVGRVAPPAGFGGTPQNIQRHRGMQQEELLECPHSQTGGNPSASPRLPKLLRICIPEARYHSGILPRYSSIVNHYYFKT